MKIYLKHCLIIFALIVLLSIGLSLVACEKKPNENNNLFNEPIYYYITYVYPECGGYYSNGSRDQKVEKGCDGEEVTVVPEEGYVFVKWNDGVETPTRSETNVQRSMSLRPIFEKIHFNLNYSGTQGGHIEGEAEQHIDYGDTATQVTAIPNDGYLFAGWSDGSMSETRQDNKIKADIDATALFVSKTKVLNYECNIPSVYPTKVTIKHGDLTSTKFYIPTRDGYIFDGWYLDPEFTMKVTDGNGYYFRGNTIFYDEENTLYPKWITERNTTFKLLLVFTENIEAQLPSKYNELTDIDYKMTFAHRQICEIVPKQILKLLNEWFEGRIIFEVDTYYATKTILAEYFNNIEPGCDTQQQASDHHHVYAQDIPEVFPILNNYRSILTTINLNDPWYRLHKSAGIAHRKYGCIYMDGIYDSIASNLILSNTNIKVLETLIETYLHEFAHTVEEGYPTPTIHDVESQYWKEYGMYGRGIELIGLYLLNKIRIENEYVGIPLDFWFGKTKVHIQYSATSFGGIFNGKMITNGEIFDGGFGREVTFGSEITVEAIPYEGFRFVEWSDGITTSIRHDTNIISPIRLFAIFEKI